MLAVAPLHPRICGGPSLFQGYNEKVCFPWQYPGIELGTPTCRHFIETIHQKFYSVLATKYASSILSRRVKIESQRELEKYHDPMTYQKGLEGSI